MWSLSKSRGCSNYTPPRQRLPILTKGLGTGERELITEMTVPADQETVIANWAVYVTPLYAAEYSSVLLPAATPVTEH